MGTFPNIKILEYESRLLKNNLMGNPHLRRLPVYLPPDYDSKRKKPYPVVYLLSGWGGRGEKYLHADSVFVETLPDRLDQMTKNQEVEPVIAVFPDCSAKLGASQYVNSTSNGRFMDYLCDELVPFIDKEFHTGGRPEFRGLLGHSSGGFGALVTGMIRPEVFSFVLSSAGDSWYDYIYVTSIPTIIREVQKAGGVEAFLKMMLASPNPLGLESRDRGETLMNLSVTTCFTPNPEVPLLKGDLWFDLQTGDLIPEVWKRFSSWDPVNMVDRYAENLKKLRGIRIEAGDRDEYGLHLGHRKFAKKLDAHGIKYELEEYPGKHGGHHYRMPGRIQWMLEKMAN